MLKFLCSGLIFSGGVMLVHDIRKNETRVIDFRETAPSAIHEEMLQTNLDLHVRQLFCCMLVITVRCLVWEQKTVILFLFSGVVNVGTLFSPLHFSLAYWWEYQACSVGCIRHTSSMAGTIMKHFVDFFESLPSVIDN